MHKGNEKGGLVMITEKHLTKRKTSAISLWVALVLILSSFGMWGCSQPTQDSTPQPAEATETESSSGTRTVVDMEGRTVEVPTEIKSVATFGSVGVLNAFVECMGKGDLIASDMPANFTKNDKWAMQYQFAPQMKGLPVLETADGIDIEAVLELQPDLCITMMSDMAQQLEENGLTVIVLTWNDTEDVKKAVDLMGEVFDMKERADEYNSYFDEIVEKADSLTADIPENEKQTAVYGDVLSLTNPHIISEWWLSAAGGKSVTAETHTKNSLEYTMEELLAWQPEVIFSSNTDTASIYSDSNLANIPAIQNEKVYVVPTVAHVWGNRTVEQPLTVLWAMNKMYPERYSEEDLSEDIKYFYHTFFEYDMTDDEVAVIINYK